jgi:hypothetical protein
MSQFFSLELSERRQLVNALLACDCMRNTSSRDQALDDLPPYVRNRIVRSSMNQEDVDNIVSACLSFAGAIEMLLESVYYRESGSRSAQRLERVVGEIKSKLAATNQASAPVAPQPPEIGEATPAPPAQPQEHLQLPYLCDRSAQERDLKEVLRRHRPPQARRPLLCVIHGDEYECHDEFIKRLQSALLPELLGLKVAVEECYWDGLPPPRPAAGYFWLSLGEQLLNPAPDSEAECRELILKKLAASESPLFINLKWYTENCEPNGAELFASFLRFWEGWPDLPANKLVICGLSLVYQRSKESKSRFGFWQKPPNERLRLSVAQLKNKSSDKLTLAVLTELQAITRKEAEDWPNHPKVRSHYQISKKVITELYRRKEDRPIAMEILAEELRALLTREALRSK